jgi:sporulation protein YabP
MDKVKEMENSFNHGISVSERKNVVVSGVKKIDKFDDEEFYIETTLGYLVIKGKELELIKLDTYQGSVSIKGSVDSFTYTDSDKRKNGESSFLGKLFK